MFLALPCGRLLSDLAFEAGTAKHAFRPPAVEMASVQVLQTGTHTAESAELLTTFRSSNFIWRREHFQDLAGLRLVKMRSESHQKSLKNHFVCFSLMYLLYIWYYKSQGDFEKHHYRMKQWSRHWHSYTSCRGQTCYIPVLSVTQSEQLTASL